MTTDPTTPTTPAAGVIDRPTRRRALLGLGALAATGAASVVAVADSRPAAAGGQGQALTLGDPHNTATATTALATTMDGVPALVVQNAAETGDGICGIAGRRTGLQPVRGAGVRGESSGSNVPGVVGIAATSDGVAGFSASGPGLRGQSDKSYGALGRTMSGFAGVLGETYHANGNGVVGLSAIRSANASAVLGVNQQGVALKGIGLVPLRLEPRTVDDFPTLADPGSFHVGPNGTLRYTPAPGRWRTVVGPGTAGALHVLPAPVRAYDSRPGTQPAAGTKAKLGAGQTRVVDLRAVVPVEASAVLLTVLLVNAATGNGNFTIWANGVARPGANSLVWGGDAGRFTTTPTTAMDVDGRVQVHASLATDVVIDVVAFYA